MITLLNCWSIFTYEVHRRAQYISWLFPPTAVKQSILIPDSDKVTYLRFLVVQLHISTWDNKLEAKKQWFMYGSSLSLSSYKLWRNPSPVESEIVDVHKTIPQSSIYGVVSTATVKHAATTILLSQGLYVDRVYKALLFSVVLFKKVCKYI